MILLLQLVFLAFIGYPALNQKVDSYLHEKNFQGTALIARQGDILFLKGYGLANEEHKIPNTPQTVFRLGSITKQFTAIATTPTVVFEMILAGKGLSVLKCRELAASCPTHSMCSPQGTKHHKKTDSCLFCQPKKIDVAPYQQKCQAVFARSYEMIVALGIDFMCQHQISFKSFFADKIGYPQLTALFEKSLPLVESLSLSRTKELNMSVSHVYVDSALHASTNTLLIEAPYQTHLRRRKLI